MTSRPTPSNPKTSNILISRVNLIGITISATAIFLLTIIYIFNRLWETLFHCSTTSPFDSANSLKLQKFSYKELNAASNGFNPDHFIGKGGSGTVFHGVLGNGNSVAIKQLDRSGTTFLQVEREFQSEISILGAIRSPHIVSLLGYCIEKNKRVLVYEYTPNRSLQDYLFSESGGSLNWEVRFQIIQDVACALEFLHMECDPPVIHGDIKPSNVLLDWEFRAKISDFGLSRVNVEDDFGAELFSQEKGGSQNLWKSQDLSRNLLSNAETPPIVGTPIEGQGSGGDAVDSALTLQAPSSSTNSRALHNLHNVNDPNSKATLTGKEVLMESIDGGSYGLELSRGEHSNKMDLNPAQWGKNWWWRQGGSGELSSKDYVTEWIGSQISLSTNPVWENINLPGECNLQNSPHLYKMKEDKDCSQGEFQLDCHDRKAIDQERREKNIRKSKPRKMQDWWKEEELDDKMSKRGSKQKCLERKIKTTIKMPHFNLGRQFCILKERSSKGQNPTHEFGVKRGWRKHTRPIGGEMSGDLLSQELSSTTKYGRNFVLCNSGIWRVWVLDREG